MGGLATGLAGGRSGDPLDDYVRAWAQEGDQDRRNELQRCIAALIQDHLEGVARQALWQLGGSKRGVSRHDVVNQTCSELATILESFLRGDAGGEQADFRACVSESAREIAVELVGGRDPEWGHPQRDAPGDPDGDRRPPTTPSKLREDSKFEALMRRAFESLGEMERRIVLRRADRAGYAAIGWELNLAPKRVRSLWLRSLRRLRGAIDEGLGGDPREE